jgi:tRNA-intron endonuclease
LQRETIEARYIENKVDVTTEDAVSFLHERGYGEFDKDKHVITLAPYEVLYLSLDKKLSVIDPDTELALSTSELLERFRLETPEIWTRYLVYRDLRDRGYVVREGFGFGIDFRVYDRGQYGKKAAKYIVFGMNEGTPVPISKIAQILTYVKSLKKEMILAVIDRRGEVVYYSVTQMVP